MIKNKLYVNMINKQTFFLLNPNSALISATDVAAKISYHLTMLRRVQRDEMKCLSRDSNPRQKSCTRLGPLKDAPPTELQSLGLISELSLGTK